jgi:hypothetical protein
MKRYFEVHYRRAKYDIEPAKTLQQAIMGALAKNSGGQSLWLRPDDRIMPTAGPDKEKLLFNTPADVDQGVAGELCLFREGAVQPVLEFQVATVQTSDLSTAQIYKILEEKAPGNKEFIRGVCYWLVIDDHVFFVTLRGFPKDLLQSFLQWLLSSQSFRLGAELDPSEVGNIGRISKFVVRGANGAPKYAVSPASADGQAKVRKGKAAVPWDKAEAAIALTIGDNGLGRLKGSLGARNRLFAETEWGVIGPRSKKLKETLSELATEIADVHEGEGDVSVMARDGEIRDGNAYLKAKMPFDVEGDGHYLLDFADVIAQLSEVYSRFSTDDKLPS